MPLPALPIFSSTRPDDVTALRRDMESLWFYLSLVKDEIDTLTRQVKELTP